MYRALSNMFTSNIFGAPTACVFFGAQHVDWKMFPPLKRLVVHLHPSHPPFTRYNGLRCVAHCRDYRLRSGCLTEPHGPVGRRTKRLGKYHRSRGELLDSCTKSTRSFASVCSRRSSSFVLCACSSRFQFVLNQCSSDFSHIETNPV